jgi:phytoene synthase
VRKSDDIVDRAKADKPDWESWVKEYRWVSEGKKPKNRIITDFFKLAKRKEFEEKWVEAFLGAMESDFGDQKLKTVKEMEQYIYGSAEVIGLMMARIMGLSLRADRYAAALGKAFQLINFIRDIEEDNNLGRRYIPREDLDKFGLRDLKEITARQNQDKFEKLIRWEIKRFEEWIKEGEKGYEYLPKAYLVPIKTAAEMFKWTARVIKQKPMIVFERKVKPSKLRVMITGIKNYLISCWS